MAGGLWNAGGGRASMSPFGNGPATLLRIGKLAWKYAQKNAKKNMTSDAMNNSMPNRSPVLTREVWESPSEASLMTSRHHPIMV